MLDMDDLDCLDRSILLNVLVTTQRTNRPETHPGGGKQSGDTPRRPETLRKLSNICVLLRGANARGQAKRAHNCHYTVSTSIHARDPASVVGGHRPARS